MGFDYLKLIDDFPNQIEEGYNFGKDFTASSFDSIVVAGMGGSAIAGDLIKSYLAESKLPVHVIRNYEIPEYISNKCLFFIISYSGNTEEALSVFKLAVRKNYRIIAITSGGKLRELCLKEKRDCITIQKDIPPRAALAYLFFPILRVLANSRSIPDPSDEVKKLVATLRKTDFREKAEDLAEKLVDKVPLIYASERLGPVAYRWKTQFNENSKTHAFSNVLPELNHNEINAYDVLKANYYVIFLSDERDLKKIKDRIKITKDLISEKGVKTTELMLKGDSFLNKMFSAIHIGDLTSYFLAKKYNINPAPVEMVEKLKERLK